MNIRKFISSVTCLALAVCSLSGCNGASQNQDTAKTEEASAVTSSQTAEVTQAPKEIPLASVNDSYKAVKIDGNTVNTDEATVWRGLGAVTGNNSSRLLMDYKTENPEAYWEIMNLLFKPDYGAGLSHVKIEFGTDVNSSSGTEPSIMRSAFRKRQRSPLHHRPGRSL